MLSSLVKLYLFFFFKLYLNMTPEQEKVIKTFEYLRSKTFKMFSALFQEYSWCLPGSKVSSEIRLEGLEQGYTLKYFIQLYFFFLFSFLPSFFPFLFFSQFFSLSPGKKYLPTWSKSNRKLVGFLIWIASEFVKNFFLDQLLAINKHISIEHIKWQ